MPHPAPTACAAVILAAQAAGQTLTDPTEPYDSAPAALRFSTTLRAQPEGEPHADQLPQEIPAVAAPRVFGSQGSHWISFGGGLASDFTDNTDTNLYAEYSYFLVDWFEVTGELGVWYHFQENEDAAGLNPVLVFRWHLLHDEDWTVYLDAGIGVLFTTDDVPEGGTHVNFTPRAGVGFTHAIGNSGARLQGGLRWHHISNARITGDRNNPATDAPMLYLGVIIPF